MPLIIQTTFTDDETSAYQEGTAYVIATATELGGQDFDIPYSELAPDGEGRPLHITHATLSQRFFLAGNAGVYLLLIESPADSGRWKMELARVKDGQPNQNNDISQGIILSSGDSLCIKSNSFDASLAPSQVIAGLLYRVGP